MKRNDRSIYFQRLLDKFRKAKSAKKNVDVRRYVYLIAFTLKENVKIIPIECFLKTYTEI